MKILSTHSLTMLKVCDIKHLILLLLLRDSIDDDYVANGSNER